jgi:hypothetical protein
MTIEGLAVPFRSYLLTGERILWTGQPKQGIALASRDALLIPFSLLWGGFAIFWNVSVWSIPNEGQNPDLFFRLWGLPFLVAGFYFIFGRFLHDAAARKRSFYAVTDQRILVLRGLMSSNLKSLDIHRLPKLEMSEHRDGTGTIEFESDNSMFGSGRNGFGYWTPALSSAVQFFCIVDARRVFELVRNQERPARDN